MTRYAVSVGDQEYQVEVQDSGLLVDGEPVVFEMTSLNDNGLHLFRRAERSTEMYFKTSDHIEYEVLVDGRCLVARVDLAYRRSRRSCESAAAGQVLAPMPGLVVDVLVQVGQAVEEGQALLVQESMKMQMQLRAPCAGRVVDVRIEVGDQVGKGADLIRITPACASDPEAAPRCESTG